MKIYNGITAFISFATVASTQWAHPIFCSEPILKAVADSATFSDSKTFVDLVLSMPVEQALNIFHTQGVKTFLQECFINGASIFEDVKLADFKEIPSSFSKIKDPEMMSLAIELNSRWNLLGRRVVLKPRSGSRCVQNCTSFLPQMDGRIIVVPGGRFIEVYYWDTYWIIKGLIACQMLETAETLLQNFRVVLEKRGFIPNGFRQYYLSRSQLPFFFLMVKEVVQALQKSGRITKARQLQQRYFEPLLKEYQYWMSFHSINVTLQGQTFRLNRFLANTKSARPESYRQDWAIASKLPPSQRENFFTSISSIAETGYDFSSRWLGQQQDSTDPLIQNIIPSDLNTLLGLMESYLASLSSRFSRQDLLPIFLSQLQARKTFFRLTKRGGRFPDFLKTNPQRKIISIYPTDYFPYLLMGQQALQWPLKQKVSPGSSQIDSGMQWDAPNVWAPNNWLLHQVLVPSEARKIAQQWVSTVYCSWKNDGNIYEKYRTDKLGKRGEGGEYEVQTGFGWTNGLVLYYLLLYGDSLTAPNCSE